MTADVSIQQELERQSVVTMECTIPAGMTVEGWRRMRSDRPRTARRRPARGAPGIHSYTLNRSPATRAILAAVRAAHPWTRAKATV